MYQLAMTNRVKSLCFAASSLKMDNEIYKDHRIDSNQVRSRVHIGIPESRAHMCVRGWAETRVSHTTGFSTVHRGSINYSEDFMPFVK